MASASDDHRRSARNRKLAEDPSTDIDSVLALAPRRITVGVERPTTSYYLAEDLIATHGAGPSPRPILAFEGGDVIVERFASSQAAKRTAGMPGPVYRHEPGGMIAVPTGRVFVRFPEGERAADHRAELEASGYRLEDVPGYAPNAAWIRPASGKITDALRNLDRLRRVPDVKGIEPQFLAEAARRT